MNRPACAGLRARPWSRKIPPAEQLSLSTMTAEPAPRAPEPGFLEPKCPEPMLSSTGGHCPKKPGGKAGRKRSPHPLQLEEARAQLAASTATSKRI